MPEKMNKIQIRAEVFSSINNIFNSKIQEKNTVQSVVDKLKTIEDKEFLAKLLIKEFISTSDIDRASLISLLLLNCIPVEELEKNLWSNLALKTVSDEKKYQLIEILKAMGKFIEYDNYLEYFEEPQTVIDMDTQKLLMSAMLNPEAQIDFLDFLATLSSNDKILLINSMVEDYSSDDLANIIAPILFSEKNEEILHLVADKLINTKSPLAYFPLAEFIELSDNKELIKFINKGLKEFKLAGITEQKAEEYYKSKFKNSILYSCYSSLVDGKGNQGLIFSRIRSDNSIQMFCIVINDSTGIVDCFGFNSISQMEFSLIVKKFYDKESPLSVTFEMAKTWLKNAEKLSFENSLEIPYEYICWKEILFDVKPQNYDNTYDVMKKALEILPAKEFELYDILSTTYLDKLFFMIEDNSDFANFVSNVDKIISEQENINTKEIESFIKENTKNVFSEKTKENLKSKLIRIAFLLLTNSKSNIAAKICTMCNDEKILEELFVEILKKSLFVFYENELQQMFDKKSDNIFMKNANKSKTLLDEVKLRKLLEQMLDDWGQDG